ncbi:hypothetical protein [Bacillus sp. FJAT-18017]|uniref:hypothetical protein n=1 Tax=Bacillus sp. FJAT-18017 TaxID=1705566 RepID=UPI000AEFCC05|nr:hypothetical protein [Bacillus sp. FJAT-18017]
MKGNRLIAWLTIFIILLAALASAWGIFSSEGAGPHPYKTVSGEIIDLYGKGLYKHDSVSGAEQEIAQDIVTLVLGIPLLIVSLFLSNKGLLKGRLLLAGTLGYFLYTYASYSFLSAYNPFFLIYVLLMSTSFFAFTLILTSFNTNALAARFKETMPVRFLGGVLIFLGIAIGLMWFGRIVPSLTRKVVPVGLDHYTTLVIQALDLGFVVPIGIVAGWMLLKRRPAGYLLGPIIIIKVLTLSTAVTAMAVRMFLAGVTTSLAETGIFAVITLLIAFCLYLVLYNVKEVEGDFV